MLRDAVTRARRRASRESAVLVALLASLAVLLVVGSARPEWLPSTSVLVPVFVASQSLGPRLLPWFTALALAVAAALILEQPPEDVRGVLRVAVVVVIGALVLLGSHRRARLGVAGSRGEAMLVDLRDRILAQGRLRRLPEGWVADSELRADGGTAFAGDFVVVDLLESPERQRLRVALVDVSGKGIDAGARSLLLSGAMGGLLEALPAQDFLGAANRFVLRQDWDEGFATAVHLDLDLRTGDVAVRSAGHPPALLVPAGGTAWRVLEAEGPALGLLAEAEYEPVTARLDPGDVLVLYTDGVVERPGHDLDEGIERLAGRARQHLDARGTASARSLLAGLGNRSDDRAVLVVQRSASSGTSSA